MAYDLVEFERDVVTQSRTIPVLVDFWAEWCAPCRMLTPVLERLAVKHAGRWTLVKVNTDVHQEIAARYGIRGIPNVKLFIDGAVANEFSGALPERSVEQWLEKTLPPRHRKELDTAETMLAQENTVAARAILEGLLEHEPNDERARILLAGSLLWDDTVRATELVANIEEHSERFPIVEAIRTIAALLGKHAAPSLLPEHPVRATYLEGIEAVARRDFDRAIDRFIEVLREERRYDEDGSRKAVIASFRILGEEHPITQKYRRAFSSVLYS
jgi:putative thioredoxin